VKVDAGNWIDVAAAVVSLAALGFSIWAVRYAKRQAKATEDQVLEARRAGDIAEANARRERKADIERLLKESLKIDVEGDIVNFRVTIKSIFPENVPEFTMTALPASDQPNVGFHIEAEWPMESSWLVPGLAPGTEVSRDFHHIRKDGHDPVEFRFEVPMDGFTCSWIAKVEPPYNIAKSFY